MKPLPLLLLALTSAVLAAEDAPRPNSRPDQVRPPVEGPRQPNAQPNNDAQRGNRNLGLEVQLSPEEQQRLHEAMQKARQDPAVREAHEHAAKAQQIAMEAQKKAHEISDDAARRADPSVAPLLEKIRKAMEARQNRQPNQPTPGNGPQSNQEPQRVNKNNNKPENNIREDNQPRKPDSPQRVGNNDNPDGGNRVVKKPNQPTSEDKPQPNKEPQRVNKNNNKPENNIREDNQPRKPDSPQRVGNNDNPDGGNRVVKKPNQPTSEDKPQPNNKEPQRVNKNNNKPENNPEAGKNYKNPQRQDPLSQLSPDEQRRVREAMGKANSDPSLKEAREAAATAQKKVMELTEELARKADPEIAPLIDKVRKAMEARRDGQAPESNRNRKPGE